MIIYSQLLSGNHSSLARLGDGVGHHRVYTFRLIDDERGHGPTKQLQHNKIIPMHVTIARPGAIKRECVCVCVCVRERERERERENTVNN